MVEIDGHDSLSIEHKEDIHIFLKSTEQLISCIIKNNNSRPTFMCNWVFCLNRVTGIKSYAS